MAENINLARNRGAIVFSMMDKMIFLAVCLWFIELLTFQAFAELESFSQLENIELSR
jgi:hypothetical protein